MKYKAYGCPIRYGLGVFGYKWSLLIIRDLMFKGRRYYGEFLTAGENISTSVLAARLENLEARGIISKANDADHGKRIIYSLTEKGLGLIHVMLAMMDWSEKYDEHTEVPKSFIDALRDNRSDLIDDIYSSLKRSRP